MVESTLILYILVRGSKEGDSGYDVGICIYTGYNGVAYRGGGGDSRVGEIRLANIVCDLKKTIVRNYKRGCEMEE